MPPGGCGPLPLAYPLVEDLDGMAVITLGKTPEDGSSDTGTRLDMDECNGFAADAARRKAIRAGVMVTIGQPSRTQDAEVNVIDV